MNDHRTMKAPSLWRQEPDEVALLLLGKLAEECNELGARAARCMIQGIHQMDPDTQRGNLFELQDEVADVLGLISLTVERLGLDMNHIVGRSQVKTDHKAEWLRMVEAARVKAAAPGDGEG